MRKEDILRGFIVIVIILFIALNINGINSFLSFHTDKTVEFGHSITVVPQAWNTTDELNLTNESKTAHAISNGYVIIDHWDDWPENRITSISEAKFRAMEDGGYKVIKNNKTTLSGMTVSKQYFENPSRDSDTVWNCIGVNYVFSKEVDDRVEDDIANIHNNEFNGFVSAVWHFIDIIGRNLPH